MTNHVSSTEALGTNVEWHVRNEYTKIQMCISMKTQSLEQMWIRLWYTFSILLQSGCYDWQALSTCVIIASSRFDIPFQLGERSLEWLCFTLSNVPRKGPVLAKCEIFNNLCHQSTIQPRENHSTKASFDYNPKLISAWHVMIKSCHNFVCATTE